MLRYSKGARCERELLNKLYGLSYSVIRSAGSGVNSISPDIVAIKNGKGLAFECKAWESSSLAIEIEKFEALSQWERNSGMDTYIAWHMNGESWFFIKLSEMKKAVKNYTVGKKLAKEINRRLEAIIC
jgi:Holliday junction resolvase